MLYSAPLVWHDEQRSVHPIDMLDFDTERNLIFDSLKETGKSIEVRIEAATADNFTTLVLLGCRALHYSGHGHHDFLTFEDGRGEAHFLPTETLKELFAAGASRDIQLVFVSACHSRISGEAFVEAGVPHVIAVRLEEPVYDLAARKFAGTFYLALAAGRTVQQAFDAGHATVKAIPHLPESAYEAEKFLLLPEYGKHDVAVFADASLGELINATPPHPPNNIPSTPENFFGRSGIMQKIVLDLLDSRLVTIHGAPGIGKTALAIEAAHYINDRRLFQDGAFFVELRGAASRDAVRFAVATALGIEAKDDGELFANLDHKRCLLVLDNCEDPLHHMSGDFQKFVSQLLQKAGGVKLLLTSRHSLGGGISGAAEKIHHLRQLDKRSAASLFIRLAPRPLEPSEAGTLMELMEHPILDFLSGHPHAISFAVPLLQDKTLSQLYDMLKSQPLETLVIPDVPEDELDAAKSFAVSIEVSVSYLRERNPEAIRLFAVMSLLPSGALPPDLDAIWGEGWSTLIEALVRASLVEREVIGEMEHFFTFPFVTAYAEKLLTEENHVKYAVRACDTFAESAKILYRMICTEKAASAHMLLALEEKNLWACLDSNRLAQPKAADEELSPTATIASCLPLILLFADRIRDGIDAAMIGYEACKALEDLKGEAGTLYAFGGLKSMLYDLEGAMHDYKCALLIYQRIPDKSGEASTLFELGLIKLKQEDISGSRVDFMKALSIYQHMPDKNGKANCLHGLGLLLVIRGKPDSAIKKLCNALKIHIEIQEPIGIASDLSCIGQATMKTDQHSKSAVIIEMSLSIHRNIDYLQGQALDLKLQAGAFYKLEEWSACIAALWQAREIFHAIDSPLSKEMKIDESFEELKRDMGDEKYLSIISQIRDHSEEVRQKPLARLQKNSAEDPLIRTIAKALNNLPYNYERQINIAPTRHDRSIPWNMRFPNF